mmetsp:Transcript_22980/g.48863  ORF Transcript_22980/g.48863 Transcript_22980/m.48863 type:complete len:415 (-) Transcript_22980:99-1343(-)
MFFAAILASILVFIEQASALNAHHHASALREDPTKDGKMFQMYQHQEWVKDLFANRTAAQAACEKSYPIQLAAVKMALAHPDVYLFQSEACSALTALGNLDHESKPYIAAAGGIEVATEAMRRFPMDKNLQLTCAHALSNGMSLYQFDVQQEAGKAGAVELVLDAQRRFPDDPTMQFGGDSGCFHDFSKENRLRWQKAGGVEYNMQTILRHFNNSAVVEQCWFAFSSGTQTPNEYRFVEDGGIELGVRCMREHGPERRIREETMQAMRAVGRAGADNRQHLAEAGFLEELVKTMQEVPLDVHSQSPACANIAIMTKDSPERTARAVKAGATELALKAVRTFPDMISSVNWAFDDQYTVYEDCLEAVAQLAHDEDGKAILASIGSARDDIETALHNKPSSPQVQVYSHQILAALA